MTETLQSTGEKFEYEGRQIEIRTFDDGHHVHAAAFENDNRVTSTTYSLDKSYIDDAKADGSTIELMREFIGSIRSDIESGIVTLDAPK